MNEMKPILSRWLLQNYMTVKSFTFWKVNFQLYNFRVPVYKGLSSQVSFHDDCWQLYYSENFHFLKNEF